MIMNFRYMRIIVMFDLPIVTATQRRAYSRFRRDLLKSGFFMIQESIYCKLASNAVTAEAIVDSIKKNKPSEGLVQVLRVTEKQYNKIEFIVGDKNSEVIDSPERLIIL